MGPSTPIERTQFAPFDFIGLFTDSEFAAITESTDVLVRKAVAKVYSITTFVDLTDPETVQLIGYLEYLGLVTQQRAGEILSGQTPR